MRSVSVVVPVLDGERYLDELLSALRREERATGQELEVLVIDSGSGDRTVEIARSHAVTVHEIEPAAFGHGRTRNAGMEATSGEVVCFLTQDATPAEGWLSAHLEALELDERVGAAFGPHLPREDTSPMIARELTEFFSGFSPDGRPALQGPGDEPFLSNVNASYRRASWEELRFRDVPYSEDQAFGRDLLQAGWLKAYHPGAAVLHAHDYGTIGFMRRYFDEYRGLREAAGHIEPLLPGRAARDVRELVRRDRAWMAERGMSGGDRALWTARAAVHHSGRRVFSALGSRAERLPGPARRAISLERRDDSGRAGGEAGSEAVPDRAPEVTHRDPVMSSHYYEEMFRFWRDGAAPLLDPVPGMADREQLHVALVFPPFTRGSGGHNTLFQIMSRLEGMGHTCSAWLYDPLRHHDPDWPAVLRDQVNEYFAPFQGPVHKGFDRWYGADVVMATGWDTVYPTMTLPNVRARAYMVNDHEPEFFPTSVEARWAEETYRLGLFCIAASPWLRDVLRDTYNASASDFMLGVDHDLYWPRPVERRRDTVVCYVRQITARRGLPMTTLALAELKRRRPDVRVVLYGDRNPVPTTFPFEDLGMVPQPQLPWVYSEATVGLSLSMTNFSLIPKEMLACGLPCVELEGISAESIFGEDGGPLKLAPFDAMALADAMETLLGDEDDWERRSQAGREFVASHVWDRGARDAEAGLREALRERERLLSEVP